MLLFTGLGSRCQFDSGFNPVVNIEQIPCSWMCFFEVRDKGSSCCCSWVCQWKTQNKGNQDAATFVCSGLAEPNLKNIVPEKSCGVPEFLSQISCSSWINVESNDGFVQRLWEDEVSFILQSFEIFLMQPCPDQNSYLLRFSSFTH